MDMLTEIYSNFKFPSGELLRVPYVPDMLLAPGVEVPPEQFEQAMDVIRSSSCICRHCYDNVPCCVFFLVCLLLTGLVIMPTIVILVMVSPIPAPPGFPVFILMTSLPWILFITIYFAQRLVRKSRLQKALPKANEILLKYKVILGATVQMTGCGLFRTCIRFWFYDTSECKTMLAALLEERHGGEDAGAFQACASRLIQQYSGEYTSCYLQGRLKIKQGVRHVGNASCLCQYIEEKYCKGQILPFDGV